MSEVTAGVIEVDAVVIGAGFAGLYSIHKLRDDLGLSVQAFDDAGDVGGTWYWNRYPGARSDTEVNAYCYSFDKELFFEWKWSERYPRQREILGYLNHVADRYDLRRSIKFDTRIKSVIWDEAGGRYTITTTAGEVYSAQFLVEAVGLLSATNFPNFPGQETFTGEIHHTARWPHGGVDLAGKRVAVIGTGSSGIQVIAEIAPTVGHLTVFQRHAQWIVPARHRPIAPGLLESIADDYDGYWHDVLYSATCFGFQESDVPAESVSPEEQTAAFERVYDDGGGFQYMFRAFNDVTTSLLANRAATDVIKAKIEQTVKNPELAALLTPSELYAKRPLCCDNYYETYNRENVTLLDAANHPILEFTAQGIRTDEGEYEFDVVVMATGFDAVSGNQLKIEHVGRGGVTLADRWHDRPRTHLGLTTVGFPNLFMIYGPMGPFTNQPPAHEAQVDWVTEAIRHLRDNGLGVIEPSVAAEENWMSICDAGAAATLFPRVNSWINGANVPGKPVTNMFYMGGMAAYMDEAEKETESGYPGFVIGEVPSPVG